MIKIKIFTVNPFQQNTYLVYDETTKECVIIDCGCLFDEEKQELKNFILENKLIPKRLLNTHLHLDHAFGNRFIYNEFGLKPEANQADEFLISQMKQQTDMYGIPLKDEPMPLGSYLNEGDIIKFGESELSILHVPGHSPGSLVFYDKHEHLLFVGDVLFAGSIGRTDLPMGDYDTLIENIQKKLMVLPHETIVFSGHGGTTTIGHEKKNNPFLQ
jgi:glyoxylase-like metal-dependent hydrolase (beta-lactamase superfamily II)